MSQEKSLKMVYTLKDGKTKMQSLLDPKEGITADEVKAAMQKVVDKDALYVKGVSADGIKKAYVQAVEVTELIG